MVREQPSSTIVTMRRATSIGMLLAHIAAMAKARWSGDETMNHHWGWFHVCEDVGQPPGTDPLAAQAVTGRVTCFPAGATLAKVE
jgi:hypothetical protein